MNVLQRIRTIGMGIVLLLGGSGAAAQETQPIHAEGYRPSFYPETYRNEHEHVFYPAHDLRVLPGARAAAVAARAQLRRAESDLNNAVIDIQRQFRRSTELRDAIAEERAAFEALNEIRAEALAHLQDDPSYQAALALRKQLSQEIQRQREEPETMMHKVLAAATVKLSYSATASAMEAAAISADPRVKAARERLVRAGARLSELREQLDEAVRSSAAVQMARKAVADSRIAAVAADAAYIEAANVANVAMDYTYYLRFRPRPYVIHSPYYPYYGGHGIGYPIGYPYNWQYPKHR